MEPTSIPFLLAGLAAPAFPRTSSARRTPRPSPPQTLLDSATVGVVEIPLAPAASALREGKRVVIDRGTTDEVNALGLDSVEQTFVGGERPASGALRLVVRLETEMTPCEPARGFPYANELGSAHHGQAFVHETNRDEPVLFTNSHAGSRHALRPFGLHGSITSFLEKLP